MMDLARSTRLGALPFLFTALSPCFAHARFPATIPSFHSIFGSRSGARRIYSLLGSGFRQVVTSDDAERVIAGWLGSHPGAEIVPVAETPLGRFGQLIFAWVEQNEQSINLHLVREGVLSAAAMVDAVSAPLVSADRYRSFRRLARVAEQAARADAKRIWSDVRFHDEAGQWPSW